MTREVITVLPGVPLKEAARLLLDRGISGLPVVDAAGDVLGVLSETDLLRTETDGGARVVGEAMSTPVQTIEASRPLAEAARRMLLEHVNRLPVVEDGKLVGIVTRADLVRAFVRSDADVAKEIREDVIVHALWLDPERVHVQVDAGEVSLDGQVDTHADAERVAALAAKVLGVVGVRSRVTWSDEG
jgi:CBS domain-containing protein